MTYTKTVTKVGNDCLITKDAHVVPVYDNGSVVGYVATCSTIYRGWMDFDTRCESRVFDDEKLAEDYCKEYFKKG